MKLEREFYNRDTLTVARELVGKIFVHDSPEGKVKARITEVEAYIGPEDKAAHSYGNRPSARTKIQYGEGGYVYTFLIYGMYVCMNVVTNLADKPEVVLFRSLEPLEGLELMKQRRKTEKVRNLCSGPGKLCQAMGITREHYGADLCGDELYIEDAPELSEEEICADKRINIDYAEEAKDYPWRFTIKDSPWLSK